jgi:hypothetical protein
LYSASAGWAASIFGGAIGCAAVALINSYRLRRLHRDWLIAPVAVLIAIGPLWWRYRLGGGAWLRAHDLPDLTRLMAQLLGIGLFAVTYLLHRRIYRGMNFTGRKAARAAPLVVVTGLTNVLLNSIIVGYLST